MLIWNIAQTGEFTEEITLIPSKVHWSSNMAHKFQGIILRHVQAAGEDAEGKGLLVEVEVELTRRGGCCQWS